MHGSSPPKATESLTKWEYGDPIGKGAFGEAVLATDPKTKKKYVVKKIRLARQSEWQRKSTYQEIKLVSLLKSPYIVPYVESWLHHGHTVNIVYGYCEQGDLATTTHKLKGKHHEEQQLRRWLAQLLLALHHMHSKHVLHRDIKCSNIFVTSEGDVQLGDFGLATLRAEEDADKHDQSIVGTPHFMSPELLSQRKYCYKTDVWSLGCVMYELTALHPAFNAFNLPGLVNKIKKSAVPALPSQYSEEWGNIIKCMLKKDPAKRPSVSQLLAHQALQEDVLWARRRAEELMPDAELSPLPSQLYIPPELQLKALHSTHSSSSSGNDDTQHTRLNSDLSASPATPAPASVPVFGVSTPESAPREAVAAAVPMFNQPNLLRLPGTDALEQPASSEERTSSGQQQGATATTSSFTVQPDARAAAPRRRLTLEQPAVRTAKRTAEQLAGAPEEQRTQPRRTHAATAAAATAKAAGAAAVQVAEARARRDPTSHTAKASRTSRQPAEGSSSPTAAMAPGVNTARPNTATRRTAQLPPWRAGAVPKAQAAGAAAAQGTSVPSYRQVRKVISAKAEGKLQSDEGGPASPSTDHGSTTTSGAAGNKTRAMQQGWSGQKQGPLNSDTNSIKVSQDDVMLGPYPSVASSPSGRTASSGYTPRRRSRPGSEHASPSSNVSIRDMSSLHRAVANSFSSGASSTGHLEAIKSDAPLEGGTQHALTVADAVVGDTRHALSWQPAKPGTGKAFDNPVASRVLDALRPFDLQSAEELMTVPTPLSDVRTIEPSSITPAMPMRNGSYTSFASSSGTSPDAMQELPQAALTPSPCSRVSRTSRATVESDTLSLPNRFSDGGAYVYSTYDSTSVDVDRNSPGDAVAWGSMSHSEGGSVPDKRALGAGNQPPQLMFDNQLYFGARARTLGGYPTERPDSSPNLEVAAWPPPAVNEDVPDAPSERRVAWGAAAYVAPQTPAEESPVSSLAGGVPAEPGNTVPSIASSFKGFAPDGAAAPDNVATPRGAWLELGHKEGREDVPEAGPTATLQSTDSKRLELLEQVVSLCTQLHAMGRWEELGAVLSSAQGSSGLPSREEGGGKHAAAAGKPIGFQLGQRVQVSSKQKYGTIRYAGPVHWDAEHYVGLELDEALGKSSGVVDGIVYFAGKPGHGVFVKASMLLPPRDAA